MIKNKKILVTGGAGFIGSHLIQRLISEDAKVSVTVKYNSIIECPRLVKVWDKINIIEADLRNTDSVSEMRKLQFDYVFHLAAYNHVGDSFKHVLENVNSNLISTINLLNYGPKIRKFIHMGSSEIYGLQTKLPFDVKEKPNPMSPYAMTKYASELFSILNSKNKKLVLARDRLGVKPLFISKYKDGFIFGSELKALKASGVDIGDVDPLAIFNYLRFKHVGSNRSIYNKVFKDTVKKSNKEITLNLKKFNKFNKEIKIKIINDSIKILKKNYYNPRSRKVQNLIKMIKLRDFNRSTLGGCLFYIKKNHLCIKTEKM